MENIIIIFLSKHHNPVEMYGIRNVFMDSGSWILYGHMDLRDVPETSTVI